MSATGQAVEIGAEEGIGAEVRPTPDRKPRVLTGLLRRHSHRVLSAASIIVVLAAWQVCATTGVVDKTLTSSPWGLVLAGESLVNQGVLLSDVGASAVLFAVGLGIAVGVGTIAGVALGWWRVLAAVLEPWVAILYSMPLIAVLPLILLWFGITFRAEVIMVVIIAVFPIIVTVMAATRNVDTDLIRMARSFRAKPLFIMRTIVLPSLISYLVASVRLAIGYSLIGVVIAEYFLGNKGIGGLIVTAGEQLESGEVLVGIAILAVASLIMQSLLRYAERKVLHWRES